jgi:molybdate transport system ATP-binding protein
MTRPSAAHSIALAAHVVVARNAGFTLDVALEVAPGETVAIMGPSGAGKSTLLSALAGLERLTGGVVRIGDDVVADARTNVRPERRGVALLGQDPRLFPHMSARENIAFGPRAHGVAREAARAEADEWLWRVGLDGSGDRRPAQLSGGQQQRVAIARALAAKPRLLLLDEPLTSLDTETAGEIRGVLQTQLAAANTTTVFVTHDAVDAVAVASRLVIIEAGRARQSGPVREVLASPASRFVATVAGLNRVVGEARGGLWRAGGIAPDVVLAGTEDGQTGLGPIPDGTPIAAIFRANAVELELEPGSWTGALQLAAADRVTPGEWPARVSRLEQTIGGVRVHTAEPAVAVDLPTDAIAALRLSPGTPVRLRIAAADVQLQRTVDTGEHRV